MMNPDSYLPDFPNQTKKQVIKITPSHNPHKERAYRKLDLKVDSKSLFMDPIIELSNEQAAKFEEMLDFCRNISRCPICDAAGEKHKYINLGAFHSAPDNGGIRAKCSNCLGIVSDDSQQARYWVRWFNSTILDEYGLSFEDGFPKLLKHEIQGNWCHNCKAHHTTMQYYDYR